MASRILVGHVNTQLAKLESESVHLCVTSPPYWLLRDYGTATWSGGDPACKHLTKSRRATRTHCEHCGAVKHDQQIGQEETVAEYLETLVGVFAEVWRVLRSDGTLWVNIGDTSIIGTEGRKDGLKAKDMAAIPERLCIALQDFGWWYRKRIVWAKKNPTPSIVVDRPADAHELIYMFSKSANYYYDRMAVREPLSGGAHGRGTKLSPPKLAEPNSGVRANESFFRALTGTVDDRNLRDVWLLSNEPSGDDHYASFPREIPRRCIQVGTSLHGCCSNCGAPWQRVLSSIPYGSFNDHVEDDTKGRRQSKGKGLSNTKFLEQYRPPETVEWIPSCGCDMVSTFQADDFQLIKTPTGYEVEADRRLTDGARGLKQSRSADEGVRPITKYEQRMYALQLKSSEHRKEMVLEAGTAFAHYIRTDRSAARPIPPKLLEQWIEWGWLKPVPPPARAPYPVVKPVVLDPFGGRGTTILVADELGRDGVSIDLSPVYSKMATRRVKHASPLMAEVTVE